MQLIKVFRFDSRFVEEEKAKKETKQKRREPANDNDNGMGSSARVVRSAHYG
jgi:hypothetical protein